jgi:hypothetical protein
MTHALNRTICWKPLWNPSHRGVGLEHLVLDNLSASGVVLAINEDEQPFRLTYDLTWDQQWRLREANLVVVKSGGTQSLGLRSNGEGQWKHADGKPFAELDGCIDIDIWPTPFTNSFPIRRVPMAVGSRQEFRMAWIDATTLTVVAQPQAYTRLEDRLYRFENLDGSKFQADLRVDADGIVLDYPEFFERID